MKYIYFTNSNSGELGLLKLEHYYIFNEKFEKFVFFSDTDFLINKSCYMKKRLTILSSSKSLDDIVKYTKKVESNKFRVSFIKTDSTFTYDERLDIVRSVAENIGGDFSLLEFLNHFGICYIDGVYYFGILEENDASWMNYKNKPQSISYGLPVRIARTIVNIISESSKVLDMCSGSGTVLIEGLANDLNIMATEINPLMYEKILFNLDNYNLKANVKCMNALDINDNFDAVILDLPYGVFSLVEKDLQNNLINKALSISSKLYLISNVEIENFDVFSHFIEYHTIVTISNFSRHIYVIKS